MLELAISNWLVRLLVLLLVFALAVGFVLIAINFAAKRRVLGNQLSRLNVDEDARYENTIVQRDRETKFAQIAASIESTGIKLTDQDDDKLRKLLKAAGWRNSSAPRIYTLIRVILVFVVPAVYLLGVVIDPDPPGFFQIYLITAACALFGFYVPYLFVQAKADRRRQEIINGFPDSLDLLLVCVEAGLGLEAAMDRVGREIAATHPLVAELFTETTLMMRAGASREDAMRRMGENSGVDEIRSFATLLIQSDKLGTSISSTLRVYALEMREARRMRAEEKAHRLPVLISIPLVTCMLPAMIGVLILPAAVGVVREIGPALTGG